MTCLLSLPDNEMCGVWIYGVLYINNIGGCVKTHFLKT